MSVIDVGEFPFMMNGLRKKFQNRINKEMKEQSMSSAHVPYLIVLHQRNGLSLKEMTEVLDMNKAHTTRMIADLRLKGYVYTDCPKEGGKKFKVYLTDKGMVVAEKVYVLMSDIRDSILSCLTQDECTQLKTIIDKLWANIGTI
jgi:DNA-binding MarR family transcriptional regulator